MSIQLAVTVSNVTLMVFFLPHARTQLDWMVLGTPPTLFIFHTVFSSTFSLNEVNGNGFLLRTSVSMRCLHVGMGDAILK